LKKSNKNIALLVYGEISSTRDAVTEEKYKELAAAFRSEDFNVESVLYNDESANKLAADLLRFDAVLVWVNPIEQGINRRILDGLLGEISNKGVFVSAHPDTIIKMGTKDVLYKTRSMAWSGNVKMYLSQEDFVEKFPDSLRTSGARVLKQYRGNGGNGVFKIVNDTGGKISIIHAKGNEERSLSLNAFLNEFQSFFENNGSLIDQAWNENIVNGMVRCYLSGKKVAGFGYQEINALYQLNSTWFAPGKRFYFTENCGLFSDLKEIMEQDWVPQLQNCLSVTDEMLPVIWDADFFINKPNSEMIAEKYSLCEINVSSVSPFPPSAIKFIVDAVRSNIQKTTIGKTTDVTPNLHA